MDAQRHPFTEEIAATLSPHLETLVGLLVNQDDYEFSEVDVPAQSGLQTPGKSGCVNGGIVSEAGDLTHADLGGIVNWFWTTIPEIHDMQYLWMTGLAIGHARTLLIATRNITDIEGDPRYPTQGTDEAKRAFVMKKAWEIQCHAVPAHYYRVDVDAGCITALERRMFEISKKAGPAGHYQWGLDAGSHQGDWDPYHNLPSDLNHNDREGSETELEVSLTIIKLDSSSLTPVVLARHRLYRDCRGQTQCT